MDSTVAGLAGVALGTVGTLAAAHMSIRSSERVARRATHGQRAQATREKAAEAYVAAIEAVQWISIHHAEDSVSNNFAESYRPRTDSAVAKLREARRAVSFVAASGVAGDLPSLALETEVALSVLDDSWHLVQEYSLKVQAAKAGSKQVLAIYQRMFDSNWRRLIASHMTLTGSDGSESNVDLIDQGTALQGSLLARLREATLVVE